MGSGAVLKRIFLPLLVSEAALCGQMNTEDETARVCEPDVTSDHFACLVDTTYWTRLCAGWLWPSALTGTAVQGFNAAASCELSSHVVM